MKRRRHVCSQARQIVGVKSLCCGRKGHDRVRGVLHYSSVSATAIQADALVGVHNEGIAFRYSGSHVPGESLGG